MYSPKAGTPAAQGTPAANTQYEYLMPRIRQADIPRSITMGWGDKVDGERVKWLVGLSLTGSGNLRAHIRRADGTYYYETIRYGTGKYESMYEYLTGGYDGHQTFGPVTEQRLRESGYTPRGEIASRASEIAKDNPGLTKAEALGAAYGEQTWNIKATDTVTARELAKLHRYQRELTPAEAIARVRTERVEQEAKLERATKAKAEFQRVLDDIKASVMPYAPKAKAEPEAVTFHARLNLAWGVINGLFGTNAKTKETIRGVLPGVKEYAKEYRAEFKASPADKWAEILDVILPGFHTGRHWSTSTQREKYFGMAIDVALIGGLAMSWAATAPYEGVFRGTGKVPKVKASTISKAANKLDSQVQRSLGKYLTKGELQEVKLLTGDLRAGIASGDANRLLRGVDRLARMPKSKISAGVLDDTARQAHRTAIDGMKTQDRLYAEFLRRKPKSPLAKTVKDLMEENRRQLKILVKEKPKIDWNIKVAEPGKHLPAVTEAKLPKAKPKTNPKASVSKDGRVITVTRRVGSREERTRIPSEAFGRMTYAQIAKQYGLTENELVWAVSTSAAASSIVARQISTSTRPTVREQEKTLPITSPAVRTIPFPETETKTRLLPQEQTRLQTVPQTQPKEQVQPETETEVDTKTAPRSITITRLKRRQRVRLDIPVKERSTYGSRDRPPTRAEMKGAVAWPQGMGWWLVYKGRDGKLYRKFYYGQKPPAGVRNVAQGPGEAYRGIQQKYGAGPQDFAMPMGTHTVKVSNPKPSPGQAGAIAFEPKVTYRKGNVRIIETMGEEEKVRARRDAKSSTLKRKRARTSKRVEHLGAGVVRTRRGQHVSLY